MSKRPPNEPPYKPPCRPPNKNVVRGHRDPLDVLPDVRDGLNRIERIVLYELYRCQRELGDRNVPTALLYGRVTEHGINIRPDELSRILARLGAMR